MIPGVGGWEFVLVLVIAILVLGPERMPEYAQKLAQGIKKLRVMAEGAKGQLKDQLGPDYEDIDWRQYDPRQYDPRRIVREALVEPLEESFASLKSTGQNKIDSRQELSSLDDEVDYESVPDQHGGDAAGGSADGGDGAGMADSTASSVASDSVDPYAAADAPRHTPFDTDAT